MLLRQRLIELNLVGEATQKTDHSSNPLLEKAEAEVKRLEREKHELENLVRDNEIYLTSTLELQIHLERAAREGSAPPSSVPARHSPSLKDELRIEKAELEEELGTLERGGLSRVEKKRRADVLELLGIITTQLDDLERMDPGE